MYSEWATLSTSESAVKVQLQRFADAVTVIVGSTIPTPSTAVASAPPRFGCVFSTTTERNVLDGRVEVAMDPLLGARRDDPLLLLLCRRLATALHELQSPSSGAAQSPDPSAEGVSTQDIAAIRRQELNKMLDEAMEAEEHTVVDGSPAPATIPTSGAAAETDGGEGAGALKADQLGGDDRPFLSTAQADVRAFARLQQDAAALRSPKAAVLPVTLIIDLPRPLTRADGMTLIRHVEDAVRSAWC
jgi:hypothetical protein